MLSNASCLIYNQYNDKFVKYVLNNIWWEENIAYGEINAGAEMNNSVLVIAPYNADYIYPEHWKFLQTDQTGGKFTFQKGDVLIWGIQDAPNEFESNVQINKHFGAANTYWINNIYIAIRPDKTIHHFEVNGS